MDKEILDLYSDYLLSSFSYTTAAGLSGLLEGSPSHDRTTRFYQPKPLLQLIYGYPPNLLCIRFNHRQLF